MTYHGLPGSLNLSPGVAHGELPTRERTRCGVLENVLHRLCL